MPYWGLSFYEQEKDCPRDDAEYAEGDEGMAADESYQDLDADNGEEERDNESDEEVAPVDSLDAILCYSSYLGREECNSEGSDNREKSGMVLIFPCSCRNAAILSRLVRTLLSRVRRK